jgi:1-deoxy-D-xylulose 5-phosphate reductoisomerase
MGANEKFVPVASNHAAIFSAMRPPAARRVRRRYSNL